MNWVLWDIGSLGLPMFIAIMGIAPLMPIFAGWVSNNKYSFIGAWRVAYMYISGEIPLVICAAAVAIMAGTFDLVGIVEAQKNMWFAVPQFIGFIIFFIGLFYFAETIIISSFNRIGLCQLIVIGDSNICQNQNRIQIGLGEVFDCIPDIF